MREFIISFAAGSNKLFFASKGLNPIKKTALQLNDIIHKILPQLQGEKADKLDNAGRKIFAKLQDQ